ncbi:unnamed protein product [Polarella glacialis]|uniref:Ubiquitinyl hydrolase 1 n=1 Tax=Polarella glacialis TaxID=89957 RepID=A0A813DC28_POLGL|nr:unnamed protein product [Polarella glacialis]
MGTPDRGADNGGSAPPSPNSPETRDLEGSRSPQQRAAPVPSPRGGASRGSRMGARRSADANDSPDAGRDVEVYTRDQLPPDMDHEMEFVVRDAMNYASGEKIRSEPFIVRNFRYRILVFPAGTASAGGATVSAFVEADPLEGLDPRWVFHGVKYQVAIVNWLDYRRSVVKGDTWTFSKEGIDRGWHDMVRTQDLTTESGWLGPENSLLIRASVCVRQADGFATGSDYNCRKEVGYIGLMNHGATCYMNGLLQCLFHSGEFRRIVYSIESAQKEGEKDAIKEDEVAIEKSSGSGDDGDGGTPSLIQALQNVFYRLQTADQAVNCRELMKSFGWDTSDAFTQHDAQELNRILCDRLEEQMKGTHMDGSIKRLFEGEMENYIECLDVNYTSKRCETFYDIQLNIKSERGQDLRTIEEALREFTMEETLEGDNAYEAEGHGKQRAKKGIRFLSFPPVLNLQLKRFHFDMERMDMVKLNSRFEFPLRIDLSSFAPGSGTYVLHSVVVHSGDVNSGHYYAHIRPNLDERWVKFDDDTVTPCSEFAAVEDNYGGSDYNTWNYFDRSPAEIRNAQPPSRPRIHNAYMLVYVREDAASDVLRIPEPIQVNSRMVDRCTREVRRAEERRKDKVESQTKIRINLVFEHHLCQMSGFWDYASIPIGHSLKMNRDQLAKELLALAEGLAEVAQVHLAIFALHYRASHRQVRFSFMPSSSTLRSHIPPVSAPHFDSSDPCLTVLCVASRGFDAVALPLRWKPSKESAAPDELSKWDDDQVMLLVVKYFCPQTRKIVTLGCHYMPSNEALIGMVKDGWVWERLKPFVDSKEVAPPTPEMLSSDGTKTEAAWECWEEFNELDMQLRSAKKPLACEDRAAVVASLGFGAQRRKIKRAPAKRKKEGQQTRATEHGGRVHVDIVGPTALSWDGQEELDDNAMSADLINAGRVEAALDPADAVDWVDELILLFSDPPALAADPTPKWREEMHMDRDASVLLSLLHYVLWAPLPLDFLIPVQDTLTCPPSEQGHVCIQGVVGDETGTVMLQIGIQHHKLCDPGGDEFSHGGNRRVALARPTGVTFPGVTPEGSSSTSEASAASSLPGSLLQRSFEAGALRRSSPTALCECHGASSPFLLLVAGGGTPSGKEKPPSPGL